MGEAKAAGSLELGSTSFAIAKASMLVSVGTQPSGW